MDNKKKTVWVINQFAGTHTSGWGERHFYFSKYWKEAGYDVTIISGSFNHVFRELPDAPKKFNFEEVKGIRFCWVKTPKYKGQSILRFWSFFVFAIRVFFTPVSKAGKPDIILVSSMPIFPILTGWYLKRKYKAEKLIFEIRDIWPLTLVLLGNVSKNHIVVKFIGWFEKFGYKKADHIVSLLPNAAGHIRDISGDSSKFVYIPNGLDDAVLETEPVPAEITARIPKDKFVVGYTGTIGLANALEYFVEAAGLLKDDPRFFFVIVGDGYLKPDLEKISEGFGNILFLEKIRKNQVQHMISHFDICFVGRKDTPLFSHGVSANKFFDYMLASKPVLDSNNYIKDPVELSGCGLIVKPDSAEAIKEGILKLYDMTPEERTTMGAKGKAFVTEHHNIKNLALSYTKLF